MWLGVGALGLALALRAAVADGWAARADYLAQIRSSQEAAAAFRQAQRWDPWMGRYPIEHGVVLLQAGQIARAAEQFSRAVSLSPWDARAWVSLGLSAWKLGRHDQALHAMQQAAGRDPTNPTIAAWLAQMRVRPQAARTSQQKEAR